MGVDVNCHARVGEQDIRVVVQFIGDFGNLIDEANPLIEITRLELAPQAPIDVSPTLSRFEAFRNFLFREFLSANHASDTELASVFVGVRPDAVPQVLIEEKM